MIEKADIFTVRPTGEEEKDSRLQILTELEIAGIDVEKAKVRKGHTQPDGSTIFYVYLGGS